jgi:prepilin signal peptidase PulO-like enzyme (type II secretory pathway)
MFDSLFLIYLPFIFLFGLIIGSFLNCLIWRLYQGESLGGRSYCPNCRHKLFWYDNIPLLSFILLRGRCRYCQKRFLGNIH